MRNPESRLFQSLPSRTEISILQRADHVLKSDDDILRPQVCRIQLVLKGEIALRVLLK